MNHQNNEENNEEPVLIEDVEMTDEIRSMISKEKLPENLGDAMDSMLAGQSIFIKADNVKRKMWALRSKCYRWRQKNENDPHQFSLIREQDLDGQAGIRIYKYIQKEG